MQYIVNVDVGMNYIVENVLKQKYLRFYNLNFYLKSLKTYFRSPATLILKKKYTKKATVGV